MLTSNLDLASRSIFLTGGSGFLGQSLINFLSSSFNIVLFNRNESIKIKEDVVIHLAGKSVDTSISSDYDEYYQANVNLTKIVFDEFLNSDAKVFVMVSSIKAVSDYYDGILFEDSEPSPVSFYGISKLEAEKVVLNSNIPHGKRVYVLRPTLIHGPGNNGNLKLLYDLVLKGIPWPLGEYENKRSYCSISNFLFIINELIVREDIASGIYNIADDEALSTNQVISLIGFSQNRPIRMLRIPKFIISFLLKIGTMFKTSFNEENFRKLTYSFVVSNKKIVTAVGKPLPLSTKDGLIQTFKNFKS